MNKQHVIGEFCKLSALVGSEHFKNQEAYDCFCGGTQQSDSTYHFSDKVMEFIQTAVKEKLDSEKKFADKTKELLAAQETRNQPPFAQLKHFSDAGDKLGMIRSLRMLMNGVYNHETGKCENGLLQNEDLGLDGDIGLMEAKMEVQAVFDFEKKCFKVDTWVCKGIFLGYKDLYTGVWRWNNLHSNNSML